MKIKRLLFFVTALAGTLMSAGAVRHFNVTDGISSRLVYEVAEDSDGFIWICTNAGMDRFDGRRIKHYDLEIIKKSNDHILSSTSLQQSPDGELWLGLRSGKFLRYDRTIDNFICEYSIGGDSLSIYDFDFLHDGNVLVATGAGLYRIDKAKNAELIALGGNLVTAVAIAGDYVLAGTDHGLHVLDRRHGYAATPVGGTANDYIRSLAVAGDEAVVGTFSSGIYKVNARKARKSEFSYKIPPIPVNDLALYGDGSVLVGVDGAGVYRIDIESGKLLEHLSEDESGDAGLSGNTITGIHVDRQKGIWIATSHSGLNYIPSGENGVSVRVAEPGNAASLNSNYINVIFEDSEGIIWYGTDKGVSAHDRRTDQWKHYMQPQKYMSRVVLSISEDARGRIWAGTYGEGVSVIDKSTGEVTRLDKLGSEYIFASFRDNRGRMWVGGINGTVTRYDPATDSYKYYDEDCVAAIVGDKNGEPIFAGNKGLGRYVAETDRFVWTTRFDTISIQYPIRSLLVDPEDDVVWIGSTGEGLIRYDRKSGTARRYTAADGMPSNTVYTIVRDKYNIYWVCTETDIYRYNRENDSFAKYTYAIGADVSGYNPMAGIVTHDDVVMLGSADGSLEFKPETDFRPIADDRIMFSDFKLNGRSVIPYYDTGTLSRNINLTDEIELTYKQNTFEIDFGVIDFAAPQRVNYEYMLEGYDKDYHMADGSHSARYTDLDPGKYTFRVRGIDLYTGNPVGERVLTIRINHPWWFSPWAIILYVMLLGGMAVLLFVHLRQRARDKRVWAQIDSFASIAHDMRTPMSMIKAPLLNVEMEKGLTDKARENLAKARMNIDKMMGMLGEMLDVRSETATNGGRLQVVKTDIDEFLQVKVEEYSMLAKFKGLTLSCHTSPELHDVMLDPVIFGHIVDNLISNAIKYTESGGISLQAEPVDKRHWRLRVIDTGIGISAADARYIFKNRHRALEAVEIDRSGMGVGLLITGRHAKKHLGKITFESKEGEGTTFIVTLPYNYPQKYISKSTPVSSVAESSQAAEVTAPEASTRSRILILEDDRDMLEYLRKSLENEYDVVASSDPLQMIDFIRNESPDLIITDVMMPKLRGDELCRLIKTDMATSHIPVILLSGLASREDIVAGLESHADDYVVKPFDIIVLKARIHNIIKSRRELYGRMISDDARVNDEDFTNELDREFMARVNTTIESGLADPDFSVSDLCSTLNMSRTSVYNKLKSLTGQSPNEYIRAIRLNHGRQLLATKRYNISEVAYMVGFSDPKYFSTCFKKQFGISPSKL